MQHDGVPEIEPGADAGNIVGAPWAELFFEQRAYVCPANAARGEFVAIPRLSQERFAAEYVTGALNGLFKRQVFEGVERVVVDEDADGSLSRQEMGQMVDDLRQQLEIGWRGGVCQL